MPRVTTIKTNFTAGEISPRLLARVDIAKFANGAKTLYNFYPLVHGGAKSRNGMRYKAAAKNASKVARLVSFIFNRSQAFVLEFGETYIRFYINSGRIETSPGVAYEISAPWDDTELVDLHYVQSADTMFLAHPGYAMRKLVRYSNTVWKLSTVTFEVPPSTEIGDRPATGLTLGATSGAGVSATAAAAAFEAADVGRYIESGAGRALIVGYTSQTVVTIDITDTFASVNIASAAWTITESAKTTLTPSANTPLGAACTLTAGAATFKNTAQVGHIGKYVEINGGLVEITGFTSATVVSGIIRTVLTGTTAAPSGGWALRETIWNAIDGYPRAVTLHEQRLIAGGSTAYPNLVCGSKTGEYFNFADGTDDADGFAFALASDQVNPIEHLASTRVLLPLTFGGEFSMTGGVEKPITPTNRQARLQTTYGSNSARPVRVSNEVIYVQRGGRKIRALGYRVETDAFNAPDVSVLSEHITGDGITEMAFQQEPDQVVWMVREDGALISMSIDRDQDAIGFAAHETDGQFESIAVIPNATDGTDQLWAVVVRTINGSTARYVEVFEDGLETDCAITGAVSEEALVSVTWGSGSITVTETAHGRSTGDTVRLSGFTPDGYDGEYTITVTAADTYTAALAANPGAVTVLGTVAAPTTAWAGLDHLEAKTIDIVPDGYVAAQQTVSGGTVTLTKAAYSVEFGLHYDGEIVTLPPEVGTGQGTAQGNAMSIHEIIVRFHKTKGGKVNGQPLPSRRFGTGAVLDQPVAEFTGDKRVENLGWGRTGSGDSDGTVTITRDQPLPMQVLGVITRLTVNDG
jgi:hypothetical protein